ncbi:MAG: hypothetical protein CUN54_02835 [Phototrophicales bacterium]|nr:MAG: hypothetical protein CUN54_02835 [Phototrophicales bacterium]
MSFDRTRNAYNNKWSFLGRQVWSRNSMNRQQSFVIVFILGILLITGLLVMAVPSSVENLLQPEATQQQQTVEAAVNQFFTQTAEARGPVDITQTAEAQLTATANIQATIEAEFNQQLTATAEFEALVEEQFNQSLTATALAESSVFGGVDVAQIVAFEIRDIRDEEDVAFIEFARDADNAWQIVDGSNLRNLPVDEALLEEFVQSFATLEITNRPRNQNLEDNGLDEPNFVLTMTNTDGTVFSLSIGDTRRDGRRYRALAQIVPGDETGVVYEVRSNRVNEIIDLIDHPPYLIPEELAPTVAEIQIAEQVFEGGRMIWIEPTGQIWVMLVDEEGGGRWLVFEDTFVEGEPEIDPSIQPPEGLLQPMRGFGKLWRENPELREALGWAVTPEFGFVSDYRYDPGGEFDENGELVFLPGEHTLFTLNGELLQFNEADSTWQLGED